MSTLIDPTQNLTPPPSLSRVFSSASFSLALVKWCVCIFFYNRRGWTSAIHNRHNSSINLLERWTNGRSTFGTRSTRGTTVRRHRDLPAIAGYVLPTVSLPTTVEILSNTHYSMLYILEKFPYVAGQWRYASCEHTVLWLKVSFLQFTGVHGTCLLAQGYSYSYRVVLVQ
jgi:hypothetical protein